MVRIRARGHFVMSIINSITLVGVRFWTYIHLIMARGHFVTSIINSITLIGVPFWTYTHLLGMPKIQALFLGKLKVGSTYQIIQIIYPRYTRNC